MYFHICLLIVFLCMSQIDLNYVCEPFLQYRFLSEGRENRIHFVAKEWLTFSVRRQLDILVLYL